MRKLLLECPNTTVRHILSRHELSMRLVRILLGELALCVRWSLCACMHTQTYAHGVRVCVVCV